MLGGGRAKNRGCGSIRGSGGAGLVYRGAGGIDGRESVGGGLWKEDRGGLAFGSLGGRSLWRNELGSGICQCPTRTGIRSRLSTEREGIDATGRRNGDCAG